MRFECNFGVGSSPIGALAVGGSSIVFYTTIPLYEPSTIYAISRRYSLNANNRKYGLFSVQRQYSLDSLNRSYEITALDRMYLIEYQRL